MKAVLYPFGAGEPIVALTADFPQLKWALAASAEDIAREIGDAAILVTSNRVCSAPYGEALRRCAGRTLRWIHFTSAGIDGGLRMGLPDWVTVTNATVVKAGMVSEHALALLLALVRRLPELQADQLARRWRHDEAFAQVGTLEGATVCVVGLGAIGRAVARKARAAPWSAGWVIRSRRSPGPCAARRTSATRCGRTSWRSTRCRRRPMRPDNRGATPGNGTELDRFDRIQL
jgi:phosphoglycerate dehydrogenase-like enzyme